jgi:hypothetical protein
MGSGLNCKEPVRGMGLSFANLSIVVSGPILGRKDRESAPG